MPDETQEQNAKKSKALAQLALELEVANMSQQAQMALIMKQNLDRHYEVLEMLATSLAEVVTPMSAVISTSSNSSMAA